MTKLDFAKWLLANRKGKRFSQRGLEAETNIVYTTIGALERGEMLPSESHVIALSIAFGLDPVRHLRMFGFLPPAPDEDPLTADLVSKVSSLSKQRQKELEDYVDYIAEREAREREPPTVRVESKQKQPPAKEAVSE